MRLLFVTAHPCPPEHVSEANLTLRELGRALTGRGHEVMLLCGRAAVGAETGGSHAGIVVEHHQGFRLLRAEDTVRALPTLCAAFAPAAVVFADSGCERQFEQVRSLGLPSVLWFFAVEPHWFGSRTLDNETLHLATSAFLAGRARAVFGVDAGVLPPFVAERAPAPQRGRDRVLFVNPVREHGVEIALALAAALPSVPFTFVETWGISTAWRAACFDRALACGNIEWLPRSTDPGAALDRARLLLLPRADEPGGCRLVVEAQRAGVPVLATDRGDLRTQVGDGGIVLPLDARGDEWRNALARILGDPAPYRHGCAAAESARRDSGSTPAAIADGLISQIGQLCTRIGGRRFRNRV